MKNIYMESSQKGNSSVKKETVHQFHVAFMTHPTQKKYRTHGEQVIKMFESAFKPTTVNCIKDELMKVMHQLFHW